MDKGVNKKGFARLAQRADELSIEDTGAQKAATPPISGSRDNKTSENSHENPQPAQHSRPSISNAPSTHPSSAEKKANGRDARPSPPIPSDHGHGKLLIYSLLGLVVVGVIVANIDTQTTTPDTTQSVRTGSTTNSPSSSSISNTSAPSQKATSPPPLLSAAPSDEKPPVGVGRVLTIAQMRYCFREHERIEAARPLSLSAQQTDLFNSYVRDYNDRCSDFKYRPGSLEQVQREVALERNTLVAEARSRMAIVSPTPQVAAPSVRVPADIPKSSDDPFNLLSKSSDDPYGLQLTRDEVREIQQRLAVAGFPSGAPDGIAGPATTSAIRKYESAQGLPQSGRPTRALLSLLRARQN